MAACCLESSSSCSPAAQRVDPPHSPPVVSTHSYPLSTPYHSTALSLVRCSWRRHSRAHPVDLELAPPPCLPLPSSHPSREPSPTEKMHSLLTTHTVDPVGHQRRVGEEGSKRKSRALLLRALAEGGSTKGEGVGESLLPLVWGLCFQLITEHTHRLLLDQAWADAIAGVVSRLASPRRGVVVFGLGSCLPALLAALEGASVLWVERVERFAQCARKLAARNGVEEKIRVVRVKRWEDLKLEGQQVDAVMTEEVSDDLLADGLLPIARHVAACLGPPSAPPRTRFVPARARVYAALLSLRISQIAGLDLRGFNAFRSNESVFVDVEHLAATDKFGRQLHTLLSPPTLLFAFDLQRPDLIPTRGRRECLHVTTSRPGILNSLLHWCELDLDETATHSFAPQLGPSARPFCRRARGQRVTFLGWERRVGEGEVVSVHASHNDTSLSVGVDLDETALLAGSLVRWPQANSLAYHWPMLADEGRNSCFDRAIRQAVGEMREERGGGAHVLDIGGGSGLLAMMAARAGAGRVNCVEMVPVLAAAARHIVAQNGYAEQVSLIAEKSTDLLAEQLGGLADVLVCEIVDDQLLGEGVLRTVQDARRRLLKPSARIIPRGAVVYAQPIEFRQTVTGGLKLDDLSLFTCDQAVCPRAFSGCKLQQLPSSAYKLLAPPIALFDFDWERGSLESLCTPRTARFDVKITSEGVLNAFIIYFHLQLGEENWFSTGPENGSLTAWDQNLRYLPIEVNVRRGTTLVLAAEHDEQRVRVGLPELRPEWLQGSVGHTELLPSSNDY